MKTLLIDGSAVAYACLYGSPPLIRPSDEENVGAAVGFANRLAKYLLTVNPTHVAIAFDNGPVFRHLIFESYKGNRNTQLDEDQLKNIARMKIIAQAIPCFLTEPYEADDYLATWARIASQKGKVIVVANDKDLHQIVTKNVRIIDVRGDEVSDAKIFEKWGISPQRIPEFQAMSGDGIDNISGATGFGVKKTLPVLKAQRDLVSVLQNASKIPSASSRVQLAASSNDVMMAYHLTKLCDQIPGLSIEKLKTPNDAGRRIVSALRALEARHSVTRMTREFRVVVGNCPPTPELSSKKKKSTSGLLRGVI